MKCGAGDLAEEFQRIMASTIWLIFCAVSVEREGLASFGGGGELVGGSAVEGAGGEDVASVVGLE